MPDELHARIWKQLEVLCRDAVKGRGVNLKQLQEVERQHRLLTLVEQMRPRKPNVYRALVFAVLSLTLLICTLLACLGPSTTEIELEAVVSDVDFGVVEAVGMLEKAPVSLLEVDDVRRFIVEGVPSGASQFRSAKDGGDVSVRLVPPKTDPLAASTGAPTWAWMDGIGVPGGERVSVSALGERSVRISLGSSSKTRPASEEWLGIAGQGVNSPDARETRVSSKGLLSVKFNGQMIEPLHDEQTIVSMSAGPQSSVIATLAPSVRCIMCEPTRISRLGFLKQRFTTSVGATTFALGCSIQEGQISLHSLNGEHRVVRRNECVEFDVQNGVLHSVQFDAEGLIKVGFRGKVANLRVGPEGYQLSWMPTYLELATSNRTLTLIVSSILSAFGVLFGAITWLKGRE